MQVKKFIFRLLLIPLSTVAVAMADDSSSSCSWLTGLAQVEGGGNSYATNGSSTATGLYQLTEGALASCGYLKETGKITSADYGSGEFSNVSWTGKDGVTSRSSFMSNTAAQNSCASSYAATGYNALSSSTKSQIGSTIPGTSSTVTQSGLVTCAYFAGSGGCNSFMSTGTTGDATTDAVLRARMENAGPEDSSCVTGTTDNTQYNGDSVDIGAGAGNTTGVYCNTDVAKAMGESGAEAVQNWKILAGSSGVGYTLVDGSSLNAAAGINGEQTADGLPWYTRLSQRGGYQAMSCIDQLLSSGLNPFFNLPSLGDILSMLENFACSKMDELFNDAVQPINSALYSSTNFGTMGGFLPELGLGSLSGGLQIQEGQGSLLNVNGNQYGQTTITNPFLSGSTSWTGTSMSGSPDASDISILRRQNGCGTFSATDACYRLDNAFTQTPF